MFPHYFVTRLGIGVLDETWLRARLKLLATTVLPSLRAQSESDFHWLITVGNDMPTGPRQELVALLDGDPRFEVVEIDHLRDGFVPRQKLRALNAEAGGLLTTRIDDDDAMHRLAVEELQTAARAQIHAGAQAGLLYHPLGYELQLALMQALPLELHGPSMGLTMLNVGRGYRDAYGLHHMRTLQFEAEQKVPRLELRPDRPSWLYMRHVLGDSAQGGKHKMSSAQGIPLDDTFMRRLGDDFGILPEPFMAVVEELRRHVPRQPENRKTLLNERVAVMSRLRDVLKQVDSHAPGDVPPALQAEKDQLYAEYLRLSQSVLE